MNLSIYLLNLIYYLTAASATDRLVKLHRPAQGHFSGSASLYSYLGPLVRGQPPYHTYYAVVQPLVPLKNKILFGPC